MDLVPALQVTTSTVLAGNYLQAQLEFLRVTGQSFLRQYLKILSVAAAPMVLPQDRHSCPLG